MDLIQKKIKVGPQVSWDIHFFGWKPCLDALQVLHNESGIFFIGYLDNLAAFEEIKEPFIGFFHHVPENPPIIENREWSKKFKGVSHYIQTDLWKRNSKKCKGIFTLCNYLKTYLQEKADIPVESILYPLHETKTHFSWDAFEANPNKLLLNPGNWVRDFEFFKKLKSPLPKAITEQWNFLDPTDDIQILGYQSHANYDRLLNQNIVFQSYCDVCASNTILECIGKNTPIILNRLPASQEYLGSEYPLFYESMEEAEGMISDKNRQWDAHLYLKNMDKSKFSLKSFFHDFVNSGIYQSLKKPQMI